MAFSSMRTMALSLLRRTVLAAAIAMKPSTSEIIMYQASVAGVVLLDEHGGNDRLGYVA